MTNAEPSPTPAAGVDPKCWCGVKRSIHIEAIGHEFNQLAGWISVKEWLPEVMDGCVIAHIDGDKWHQWSKENTLENWYDENFTGPIEVVNTVFLRAWAHTGWITHWMPLPAPPTSGKQTGGGK